MQKFTEKFEAFVMEFKPTEYEMLEPIRKFIKEDTVQQ